LSSSIQRIGYLENDSARDARSHLEVVNDGIVNSIQLLEEPSHFRTQREIVQVLFQPWSGVLIELDIHQGFGFREDNRLPVTDGEPDDFSETDPLTLAEEGLPRPRNLGESQVSHIEKGL
jgi:hypothetical protein